MNALPNPFDSFAEYSPHSASSAVASSPHVPSGDATASFTSTLDPATGVGSAAGPGLTDSPVPVAEARFVLDVDAFFDAIEALEILARFA